MTLMLMQCWIAFFYKAKKGLHVANFPSKNKSYPTLFGNYLKYFYK